jgi:hypothetical protein
MTLALLTDSGWWRADLTRATNLVHNRHWGYKRGCKFYTDKCLKNQGTEIVEGVRNKGIYNIDLINFCQVY